MAKTSATKAKRQTKHRTAAVIITCKESLKRREEYLARQSTGGRGRGRGRGGGRGRGRGGGRAGHGGGRGGHAGRGSRVTNRDYTDQHFSRSNISSTIMNIDDINSSSEESYDYESEMDVDLSSVDSDSSAEEVNHHLNCPSQNSNNIIYVDTSSDESCEYSYWNDLE
jgi:hypothetical protein